MTAYQPQAVENEGINCEAELVSSTGPNPDALKAPVSAKKLEANRQNAKQATGPRTEAGKAKSAGNSYRHGFFAHRLFLHNAIWAKDKDDYETVANGVYQHYQPVGYLESFWVEKIATEALRLARLIDYEQKILDCRWAFESRAAASIMRYKAASNVTWVRHSKNSSDIRNTERPNRFCIRRAMLKSMKQVLNPKSRPRLLRAKTPNSLQ